MAIFDPNDQNPAPEAKIAVAMLRLTQALSAARGAAARDEGLSSLGMQALIDIGERQERAMVSWLAARYGVSMPTLSDTIGTLVGKGWVAKAADPRDGRSPRLTLTADGKRTRARLQRFGRELEELAKEIPEDERGTVLSALVRILRGLERRGHVATDRMCVTCTHFRRDVHRGARPHHCALLDVPLAPSDLRVDCPDHLRLVGTR